MMTSCYSYLLLLLFLLLITHWTNTASLRSFPRSALKWSLDRRYYPLIVDNEGTTSEPVLSRRRPQLISKERRRRWSKDEDNDEVEIAIDNESTILSNDDISLFNSTITEVIHPFLRQDLAEINQTDELTTSSINEQISENNNNNTNNEQSTENIVPSITTSNEIIDNNGTESGIVPTNVTETNNEIIDKNSTESVILPSNVTEINNEVVDNNSTESGILPTNVTEINQEISNEKNDSITDNLTTVETIHNETETSAIPISINQTIEETSTMTDFKQDTAIILLDYVTIPPVTNDDNQTSIDSETQTISEYNTTGIDEIINTTTILDIIQKTTVISDTTQNIIEATEQRIVDTTIVSDVTQNETNAMVNEEDEYSNETTSFVPKTTVKPICDRSCQCLKKCPYGFEILDETCQCDPPCKNYQCFGNDTCTVSKKGEPLCQPEKGAAHNRPTRCYQPRDAGYHDTDIRYHNRWYYNPDQDECHLFVYRGLGGNENNFQTLHKCHLECITCAPSPDPGTCLARMDMWYYDYKKNQCSQFVYSGCKGNENKFLRKQECIDTCITRILNL